MIEVQVDDGEDPRQKVRAALELVSPLEQEVPRGLKVNANFCGGVSQVEKIGKALRELSGLKPNWGIGLHIGGNGLESVPETIWELANLEELWLVDNKLKAISPAITKLAKLRWLGIGWNPFERFPEVVCKLVQLEHLIIRSNGLTGLPSSLAALRNLLELNLGGNEYERFPELLC